MSFLVRKIFATPAMTILAIVVLTASCTTHQNSNQAVYHTFYLTNAVIDGESVEVFKAKSKPLGVVAGQTNFIISFGANASLGVYFEPKSFRPNTIVLETPDRVGKPGAWMYDLNADGMPDVRRIKGESKRQAYYLCNWYYYSSAGTNITITYEGNPLLLFFNGTNWCVNTNAIEPPRKGLPKTAFMTR